MKYDTQKIESFIQRIQNSRYNTFHALCSQFFNYLEVVFTSNLVFITYSNQVPDWVSWSKTSSGGVSGDQWSPPKNETDHKSLTFALYKLAAMEQFGPMSLYHSRSFDENINLFNTDFMSYLSDCINEIIAEEERLKVAPAKEKFIADPQSNNVFIVHGRDELSKQMIARFIDKIGLKAVILHEQANRGTEPISEKLKRHSRQICAAVILLTPDDEGRLKPTEGTAQSMSPRARQNVVFEMGYFIGCLGADRVFGLMKGGIEKPSDYDGIYIDLDSNNWKFELVRDFKSAGIAVDVNAVFE